MDYIFKVPCELSPRRRRPSSFAATLRSTRGRTSLTCSCPLRKNTVRPRSSRPLALGKIEERPFSSTDIAEVKRVVVEHLSLRGFHTKRDEGDRVDIPIDFRVTDLLLRASQDPEVARGLSPKECE